LDRQLRQKPARFHQVEVLHVGAGAQVRDQAPEHSGFEFIRVLSSIAMVVLAVMSIH